MHLRLTRVMNLIHFIEKHTVPKRGIALLIILHCLKEGLTTSCLNTDSLRRLWLHSVLNN